MFFKYRNALVRPQWIGRLAVLILELLVQSDAIKGGNTWDCCKCFNHLHLLKLNTGGVGDISIPMYELILCPSGTRPHRHFNTYCNEILFKS